MIIFIMKNCDTRVTEAYKQHSAMSIHNSDHQDKRFPREFETILFIYNLEFNPTAIDQLPELSIDTVGEQTCFHSASTPQESSTQQIIPKQVPPSKHSPKQVPISTKYDIMHKRKFGIMDKQRESIGTFVPCGCVRVRVTPKINNQDKFCVNIYIKYSNSLFLLKNVSVNI